MIRRQGRRSAKDARDDQPFNVWVVAIAVLLAGVFVVRWVIVTDQPLEQRAAPAEAGSTKTSPKRSPIAAAARKGKNRRVSSRRQYGSPRTSGSALPSLEPGHYPPASITSNCSTDVTARIVSWINSVPNGSTLRFRPGACYRIDDSIRVVDRRGLTIDGNGATFKAVTSGTTDRVHWWIIGGSDITISDMTVRGSHPSAGAHQGAYRADREGQAGFLFQGVQGALLTRVNVFDVYGDAVSIYGDGGGRRPTVPYVPSRHVTVRNSRFERTGRHGVTVLGAEGVLVENNDITDVGFDAFDIEADSGVEAVRSLVLRANRLGSVWLVPFAFGGNGSVVQSVSIIGNVMRRQAGTPVVLVDAPNGSEWRSFHIEGNTFIVGNSSRAGIEFHRTSTVQVTRNLIVMPPAPLGSSMAVVRLYDSHYVRVDSNTIRGAYDTVLDADASSSEYSQSGNQAA